MANEEQVAILRRGADVWNSWRAENLDIAIDLENADLRNADLDRVDLSEINLIAVRADHTSFRNANFFMTSLQWGTYAHVDFQETHFVGTIFNNTSIDYSNLADAKMGDTRFVETDLSRCDGLDAATHYGPSTIGLDTLQLSRGLIPELFLRGCGLSDVEIEFAKLYRENLSHEEITDIANRIDRLCATRPIQFDRKVFISYSHKDTTFVVELEKHLNANGIRFWRDRHDLKAGPLEAQIDHAIRLNPVVILVLSQHSVESDWVEYEASKARALEKELNRHILCPVALDDSWKSCSWSGPLRKQIEKYNILDFSTDIDTQFAKLKEGLGLFYAK